MSTLQSLAYRVLPFALCVGVLAFLRWSGLGVAGVGPQSTTVALGFLLISAFLAGKAAKVVALPRITGYLLVGLLIGPHILALLTKDMVQAGKAVEGLAVALIALTAGGEIKLEWVRSQIKRLLAITFCEFLVVFLVITPLVFFLRAFFPFVPDDQLVPALVIAAVFGSIAVANSPTVTIAVISENAADGPLSRTIMGVTVIKDVVVIVLFSIALAVAKDVLGEGGGDLGLTLARELGGSVLVGIGIGFFVAWFLEHVDRDTPVFVLALCFGISELASAFHLETLLIALTAGFYVENVSSARGESLIAGIERVSLPVYALFFATAGAKVDLPVLETLGPLALLVAGARAVAVWVGTRFGAVVSHCDEVVKKYAWLGFISQAGVTLALSTIVARAFPTWGAELQILIVAMIAIHEVIGPIGLQFALRRADEIGRGKGGHGGGH